MKFTPEDFIELCNTDPRSADEYASELANAKLGEWLKDAILVYKELSDYKDWAKPWYDQRHIILRNVPFIQARLVCVEEIK